VEPRCNTSAAWSRAAMLQQLWSVERRCSAAMWSDAAAVPKRGAALQQLRSIERRCSTRVAPQHEEEGDAFFATPCVAQKRRRRRRQCHHFLVLLFLQRKEEEEANVVCGATLQRCVSCAAQLHKQTNKQNKHKKKKLT